MGVGGIQGRVVGAAAGAEQRVEAVMAAHGRSLLRVANRWSLCHDDAMDAYQRALEIYLRRMDTVDAGTEVAWLKVVVRNEALAIRRSRSATVDGSDVDPDQSFASDARPVEEEIAGDERVKRSAEALRALKPDEARALMLKAEGLTYTEISERCGWSYTKTNRSITEGRRRFLEVFRAIESGDACESYAGTLAALAGGTATSEEIVAIRPHLKHCMACRATVRELHVSKLRGLTLIVPAWLLAPIMSLSDFRDETEKLKPAEEILREAPAIAVPDAAPDHAASAPHAIDLAGHLLATPERLEQFRRFPRLGRVRDEALALVTRSSSSDVASGIYVASSSSPGGGRIGAIAATVGFCVSSLGAGMLCVATGVVEAPGWMFHREVRPAPPHAVPHKRSIAPRSAESKPARFVAPTPTPALAPPPRRATTQQRPAASKPRRSATVDRSQGTTPTSHESPPIADASRSSSPDFTFEGSGAPQTSNPDPAPATGGGEFSP